jgi:hypothetical protein
MAGSALPTPPLKQTSLSPSETEPCGDFGVGSPPAVATRARPSHPAATRTRHTADKNLSAHPAAALRRIPGMSFVGSFEPHLLITANTCRTRPRSPSRNSPVTLLGRMGIEEDHRLPAASTTLQCVVAKMAPVEFIRLTPRSEARLQLAFRHLGVKPVGAREESLPPTPYLRTETVDRDRAGNSRDGSGPARGIGQ